MVILNRYIVLLCLSTYNMYTAECFAANIMRNLGASFTNVTEEVRTTLIPRNLAILRNNQRNKNRHAHEVFEGTTTDDTEQHFTNSQRATESRSSIVGNRSSQRVTILNTQTNSRSNDPTRLIRIEGDYSQVQDFSNNNGKQKSGQNLISKTDNLKHAVNQHISNASHQDLSIGVGKNTNQGRSHLINNQTPVIYNEVSNSKLQPSLPVGDNVYSNIHQYPIPEDSINYNNIHTNVPTRHVVSKIPNSQNIHNVQDNHERTRSQERLRQDTSSDIHQHQGPKENTKMNNAHPLPDESYMHNFNNTTDRQEEGKKLNNKESAHRHTEKDSIVFPTGTTTPIVSNGELPPVDTTNVTIGTRFIINAPEKECTDGKVLQNGHCRSAA
uniref:Putative serine/threonine-protein kinase n=1 Tax=Xenopsylla cheopis TaxID=163159 RepID=A0A6M2E163_XENCH